MEPAVEIRRSGDKNFHASVGIGKGMQHYQRDGLVSVAACVADAAAVLGREFSFATISYDDVVIGSYPVAVMQHRALELADELMIRYASRLTPA